MVAMEENVWLGRSALVTKRLKAKIDYNTKINNGYFKRKKLQQWGSQQRSYIPVLIDDLDIMEQLDIIFDKLDEFMI